MRTSLKRIYTTDNIELVGLLYEPEIPTNEIVVQVHGMSGNFYENRFLDFLAKTLTDNGVAFFAFNNRGCELIKYLTQVEGEIRKMIRIGNAYEIFEDCILDIKSAMDFVNDNGYSRIHLSGHSLGSPKVAYYAAEGNDNRLASIIFLSPSDMVGLAMADKNYIRDIEISRKMVAEGKAHEFLPHPVLWDENFLSAQTYMSIGSEDSKIAIFNFHDPNDKLEALSKIKIPTIAIMGRKDDALVVPIEEMMERIKKAMKNSPKVETNILGDATHGYAGYEQKLADTVLGWVKNQ